MDIDNLLVERQDHKTLSRQSGFIAALLGLTLVGSGIFGIIKGQESSNLKLGNIATPKYVLKLCTEETKRKAVEKAILESKLKGEKREFSGVMEITPNPKCIKKQMNGMARTANFHSYGLYAMVLLLIIPVIRQTKLTLREFTRLNRLQEQLRSTNGFKDKDGQLSDVFQSLSSLANIVTDRIKEVANQHTGPKEDIKQVTEQNKNGEDANPKHEPH